MGFVDAVKTCFAKYADFNGRARRAEYWYWALFMILVSVVLQVLMGMTMGSDGSGAGLPIALLGLFVLATIVPSLAVAIRRLHDSGRSGWWYLLNLIPLGGFVVLYFMIVDSEAGPNKYGPNPKGLVAAVLDA
jgi:uncharacterized membrane protein YhaH (DUF805 family)